jgi:hypothetical protein
MDGIAKHPLFTMIAAFFRSHWGLSSHHTIGVGHIPVIISLDNWVGLGGHVGHIRVAGSESRDNRGINEERNP